MAACGCCAGARTGSSNAPCNNATKPDKPFLELTLRCCESGQPRYEHALEEVGALAVTLLDADADTSNEHAILGPGVGETPLRNTLLSSALFAHDIDVLLLAMLKTSDTGLDGHDPLLQRHVLVHPRAFPVLVLDRESRNIHYLEKQLAERKEKSIGLA